MTVPSVILSSFFIGNFNFWHFWKIFWIQRNTSSYDLGAIIVLLKPMDASVNCLCHDTILQRFSSYLQPMPCLQKHISKVPFGFCRTLLVQLILRNYHTQGNLTDASNLQIIMNLYIMRHIFLVKFCILNRCRLWDGLHNSLNIT